MEELFVIIAQLNLTEVFNFQKFNSFAITTHRTQLEGSTLTNKEIELFQSTNRNT